MLLNLLFPNRCVECAEIIPADRLVCQLCHAKIHFTHWQPGEENLLLHKCRLLFPVESAVAMMYFDKAGLSRKLVHELKYQGRESAGKMLATMAAERINFTEKPQLLVPIPLHPRKERARGYNQLHLFTQTLGAGLGIAHRHEVLKRNHYQKAQALQDQAHRENKTGIFSLNEDIRNTHVLLVDDVFTTGNTIAAAAWEILKNPGNTVSVLVIAIDY